MSIIKPIKKIAKPRKVKPKISRRIVEKRVYPSGGARMNTAQYIAAYYDANCTVWGCTSGASVYENCFKAA